MVLLRDRKRNKRFSHDDNVIRLSNVAVTTVADKLRHVSKRYGDNTARTVYRQWLACCKSDICVSLSLSGLAMKKLVLLADGPTVYVRCQGLGICCVSRANPLALSLHSRLAPSLPLENSSDEN